MLGTFQTYINNQNSPKIISLISYRFKITTNHTKNHRMNRSYQISLLKKSSHNKKHEY